MSWLSWCHGDLQRMWSLATTSLESGSCASGQRSARTGRGGPPQLFHPDQCLRALLFRRPPRSPMRLGSLGLHGDCSPQTRTRCASSLLLARSCLLSPKTSASTPGLCCLPFHEAGAAAGAFGYFLLGSDWQLRGVHGSWRPGRRGYVGKTPMRKHL